MAAWPGWYLPVRMPWSIGENTTWLIPSSRQVGTTSASITRYSALYCGWLETNGMLQLAGQCVTRPQLVGRPLADPDVERLAGPDDVGEGLHRLLERGEVVVAVGLVEVDVVGLQPASARR